VKKENQTKDSLVNTIFIGQQSIISNQQRQLTEKDILYSKNRSLIDSLAANQGKVEKYNLGLSKKLSRAKTANKILIGAAATLAAIVTVQNIK